ncbi:MAG: addiction module protein [Prosthecobacter sp.]|uniref:addiction module protein n=1 Tax=Prosthecobacter sp. TaxID=1965333 RepID=UPI0039038046
MTATVERLKNEIRSLPKDDLDDLLRDIQSEYVLPSLDDDEKSVAAAWDEEINRRAQEVMDGTVELISGEESDRMMDALYAKHGIQRKKVA